MSDEMAVGDKASSEEAVVGTDDIAEDFTGVEQSSQASTEASSQESEENEESESLEDAVESKTGKRLSVDSRDDKDPDDQRGIKRRASAAFSDEQDTEFKGFEQTDLCDLTEFNKIVEEEWKFLRRYSTDEDFKGFDHVEKNNMSGYCQILEHLEAEVSEAVQNLIPLRKILPTRANKRPRQDTDSSRPSSALSSRSEGDVATDHQRINGSKEEIKASSSPANRGRRPTTEMSSPLLRVPLERGWKRELVFRAALDAHSRRNADIYYYTPMGKKLRSTREVAENLSGTGLTLENFSFFKEPLGIDDPEKEIIRDAKVMRRVESPVPAPAAVTVDAKRTPKPKPPKGASPEPNTPKSPPAKLKIKSIGSRINNNSSPAPPVAQKQPRRQSAQAQSQPQSQAQTQPPPAQVQPAPAADNNNSAAWKKPRTAPPPLHARPQHPNTHTQIGRGVQQPCSMSCGRGAVPSLACAACLCLYHPVCLGLSHVPPHPFFCKNCDTSSAHDPPPLIHKSGSPATTGVQLPTPVATTPVTSMQLGNLSSNTVPVPRRVLVPSKGQKADKRVLLRMKMSGGADGQKVWAVSPSGTGGPSHTAQATSASVANPSSLAPQAQITPTTIAPLTPTPQRHRLPHDKLGRGRVANGAASPPASLASPRRRGRPKMDDSDHFTSFYKRAQEKNYNVAVQIFQYVGMRDLARCARVCKLWQTLTESPALWRHVRMKNSHVSDWGGLCAVLKKRSTKWLDLRKMLLPTNDTIFWDQFIENIGTVDTLERLELCRCPARVVEAVCRRVGSLRALCAPAICDTVFDPAPLADLRRLELLRLKSLKGLSLTRDLQPLSGLHNLQHLSLTSIKELGWCACEVVGQLEQLESLELGECSFGGAFASALARLVRLRRLRLERGVPHCAAPALLKALASLPKLTRLELVNFDVKVGFDDALAECKNIQRLLIIPTYVSQSATTNKQVLSGVLRLKDTLTHLMWGVTIELLRVTELFIDQCEAGGEVDALGGGGGEGEGATRRELGECIPVLKPVPGCRLPDDLRHVAGPPQVEILPIPTLQRLLSAQLPNTKLKLLRIPFHATWRQTLADFQ